MRKRIVVKLGTSVLTGGGRQLNQARMVEIARQCAALYEQGHDLIVCTSGAVAAGRAHLNFPALPPTITSKQLFAAVGQLQLMRVWERLFDIYGVRIGQILLTRSDVENRQRYINARDTFAAMLEHRIVPVVNENDAVATEEIRVGDNDNLSALVATLVNADLLILLTDQPGLFTADPRSNPNAQLIPEVRKIDETLKAIASGSVSGLGTGGMATKLQAANTARHAGVDVVIAAGSEPNVILRVVAGEAVGTRFPALTSRIESRKAWILAGPKPAGRLVVDEGAAFAICHKGRSLLPAGIRKVEGNFLRGDTVLILDGERRELARGIASYTAADLRKIAGCRSDEIETILGYTYGDVAVHRNDMILLTD
ncbi:glutamate 5-kinase [Caldilinea sp.]|jgi:glutamate 5-kinase|uniref:glutamate 5-kinase n=1 Tax=Caldilinea sp. TaxID=2293560 RepID=UPI0021DE4E89|nr:glutamate 5-kinase [Caldilinea sp.]GIV67731.1 MAG: glutamate 5-kinase [Caldilinea sp.]